MTMNSDEDDKVNLAKLYKGLADAMQTENPEFKKILKSVRIAASKGLYSLRIEIDDDTHEWVRYPYSRTAGNIKPPLIKCLEDSGFSYGNEKKELSFWGNWHRSMLISWA